MNVIGMNRIIPAGLTATNGLKSLVLSRTFAGKESLFGKILHGEKEDTEHHSKLVARGKYVHEFQFHKVRPDRWDEYTQVCQHYLGTVFKDVKSAELMGSFNTIIGENEQVVHLWRYSNYTGLDEALATLRKDQRWQEFQKQLRGMLAERSNEICQEFAFWNTDNTAKSTEGGYYELRTYRLKPGNLLAWEQQWRIGLEYRKKYCQPVGAWFTQIGKLHHVHHMWYYPDLASRKHTREAAWQNPGWADTVAATTQLVQIMEARILSPTPYSPMK